MQNKNNVQKKNSGKFNKFKPKFNKPSKKKHSLEDDEIKGIQEKYQNIPVPSEIKSFYDFPLSRNTLRGLKQNKFKVPTDIQKQAIGPALLGKDVLGAAQTGSGKTLGKINFIKFQFFISSIYYIQFLTCFSFSYTDS